MALSPYPHSQALFGGAFAGRTVLLTGHTGFKGAWLAFWLERLGARVVGYALAPPTTPNLHVQLGQPGRFPQVRADVRDLDSLLSAFAEFRPEIVFHLAAQPLVRASYRSPVDTYDTNVMGTVNLLEAVRRTPGVRACVVVTSDKCYENREWPFAYRENDAMGGHDPYSSSKGCAELVASAYRSSYFHPEAHERHGVAVATVRAGNVIGGGDWAEDRIVPDCVRALSDDAPIIVRNPGAIRPWQHVLEPLSGYLALAAKMLSAPRLTMEGWNFAPSPASNVPVGALVEAFLAQWGGGRMEVNAPPAPLHEAHFLRLDATKAAHALEWRPVWNFNQTIERVAEWYAAWHRRGDFDAAHLTAAQIDAYAVDAARLGVAWAKGRAPV